MVVPRRRYHAIFVIEPMWAKAVDASIGPPAPQLAVVVEVRYVGARDGEQFAVAEHRPFRRSGRAGGEDDGHQAIGIGIERRGLCTGVLESFDIAGVDHDRGPGHFEHGGALARACTEGSPPR